MRALATRLSLLGGVFVALCGGAWGQTEKTTPPKPDRSGQLPTTPVIEPRNKGVLIETREDYRISPGDMLDIQVEDASELSKIYRVNANGSFAFPPFNPINCQGQTAETLARQIEKMLRDNDYLKMPQVTVLVRQYNSQTFYVHGEVRQPGVYQVEGRPLLLKLISLAGGFSEKHGATIYLLHPEAKSEAKAAGPTAAPSLATADPGTLPNTQTYSSTEKVTNEKEAQSDYALTKIRISELLKGDPRLNLRVDPETVIYVPEADVFYVGGEVNLPGAYPIKEGATLRQALSLARGYTNRADLGKGVIFREKTGTMQRAEIRVNIKDVMNGKAQDITLQANDILVLPDSRTKTITTALLQSLPSGAAVALGQVPYIFR